jgi:hypothetical protein
MPVIGHGESRFRRAPKRPESRLIVRSLNAKAAPLWGPLRSLRNWSAYLNWKIAVWGELPSSSWTVSVRQVPFQPLSVFQT